MNKRINFLLAAVLFCGISSRAAALNEWTFEGDLKGTTLHDAISSGTAGGSFSPSDAVSQADGDGGLYFANQVDGTYWSTGVDFTSSVAAVAPSSEIRYLRYDVDYDFNAESNDTGSLLALTFSDSASTNVAGFALAYSIGIPPDAPIATTSLYESEVLDGHMSVIAKVDLLTSTMSVWYGTSANFSFNESAPNETVDVSLTTFDQLVLKAGGDFVDTPSGTHAVVVDDIRTANTWSDITDPLADAKAASVLSITFTSDSDSMAKGTTNTLSMVVKNTYSQAAGVTTVLSHNGATSDFTITPHNTAKTLEPNQTVTNTYDVVANAEGTFKFTGYAKSASSQSDASDLSVVVGRKVSFLSYAIQNDVGGLLSNVAEPGESFDLVVTIENNGVVDLTSIESTLTTTSSSITSLKLKSGQVPTFDLAVGQTTTLTYEVVCKSTTPNGDQLFTMINKVSDKTWTNPVGIRVVRAALPSVAPSVVTLNVAPGETATASVVLANDGNAGIGYTLSDNGLVPVNYGISTQSVSRLPFMVAELKQSTVFSSWNDSDSISADMVDASWTEKITTAKPLGFTFMLYGNTYDTFAVAQHGWVKLSSSSSAHTAVLAPYVSGKDIAQASIRYDSSVKNRLVVAWDNGSDEEFQVRINQGGTVDYLYAGEMTNQGLIGLYDETNLQSFDHTPGNLGSRESLLLKRTAWVRYASDGNGYIEKLEAPHTLTFTADATDQLVGSYTFTANVNWEGTIDPIQVTVNVIDATASLSLPPSFVFSGPVGYISAESVMTVTNDSNVSVRYSLTDAGLRDATYNLSSSEYSWTRIPLSADYILGSELDSEPISIGFPFAFFGESYTALTVGTDGSLIFADGQTNSAFSAHLFADDQSRVSAMTNLGKTKFIVTWENMVEPKEGGRQTFQTILNRSGAIQYNYQSLGAGWTNGVIQVVSGTNSYAATLVNDTTVTTNTVVTDASYWTSKTNGNIMVDGTYVSQYTTNVTVSYEASVSRQSLRAISAVSQIITASPLTGTILPNTTAAITFRGDARNLTAVGDTTSAFEFIYEGGTNSVPVTFSATNSVATGADAPVIADSMWGTDNQDVVSVVNADGTRSLSWPAAGDSLSRTYTIWYTTDLSGEWQWLAAIDNDTTYVDTAHNDAVAIFYKVSVE